MKFFVLYLFSLIFSVVLSDYETQGSLIINSSQAFYHFCEFQVLPKAVYPFNNKTVANDVSSSKGVGFAEGTEFSPGIHGEEQGSIEVQGRVDSYIELRNDAENLDIKKSITILLYVYPLGGSGPIVNYKKDGHGVQIYEDRFSDRALATRVNRRNLRRTSVIQKTGVLTRNEWHYVGMTYDYDSGLVTLWHNDQEVASGNIGITEIATQFDVRIGARQWSKDDHFKGRVACLQFYSTALTQRQIEKARIACKPFEPISRINLVVHHKSRSIEVNENISVAVYNDKNTKFGEYLYDLGDGSPTVTSDRDVIHYRYSTSGNFPVKAIIFSRCRNETLVVRATVTVERPLELLGNLNLSCDPVSFPSALVAVLSLDRGTDFKCYWNFSDGHVSETDFADQGLTHKLNYKFRAAGTYTLNVSCVNMLSTANVSSLVFVQVPITGLVIEKITPKTYRSEFLVTWRVQSGSDIHYSARFENKELKIFKGQNDSRGWAWIRREDHVSVGLFGFIVTANNKVSAVLQASETIRIEREVQPFVPVVYHSDRDIEVNETVILSMTKINEENAANPCYCIDLGDDRNPLNTRDIMINISYPAYGDFLVTINASNNVSFFIATILIKVHKPVLLVEDLSLTTEPTIFLQTTVISAYILRASDVICTASFNEVSNYSKEFDLRAQSAWDPVKNLMNTNVPKVKFFIKHNYTKVGVYIVTVICRNRLSEKTATIAVIVQKPITGARLIPIKPIILGKLINISFEIISGTNTSFSIDFNEYRFRRNITGHSTFHILDQNVYKFSGIHEYTVTVWNLVTSPISIQGHVIVEIPIQSLAVYVIGNPREIEVNESVRIAANLKNGSNPEFLFDFNDGSEPMVTQRHVVDYKFNPHCHYVVNVTARNNVSQESSLLIINVIKPVLVLRGVSLRTAPTAVNDVAKLLLYLREGSDFFCHLQFGDGSSLNSSYHDLSFYADGKTAETGAFQNLTFNVEHRYSFAGIFVVTARCQNRLSSEVASAEIVIQTLVKGLRIPVIPTQVVGREFQVSWSISSGTNATFQVIFKGGEINSIHTSELDGYAHVVVNTSGEYFIQVMTHNLVTPIQTRSAIILAEVSVTNITVNVTFESRELEIEQIATFTVQLGAGTSPIFLFDFGDGNKLNNTLGKISYTYIYKDIYLTQPNISYQVCVSAYNNVSSVVTMVNVTVHRPVLHLHKVELSTLPSNVSENARIILSIDQGSDYFCDCDLGDRSVPHRLNLPGKVFLGATRTPVENFNNQSYQIDHIYQQSGKYHLFVECKNRLSYGSRTREITIQEPIKDLKISNLRPRQFNETFVISWQITNGTDVNFRIHFGNLSFKELGGDRNVTIISSEYKTAGVFQVVVEAWNLVSKAVAKTALIIQHPVSIHEAFARLPQQGGSHSGQGFHNNKFPAGRDITFQIFARGTNLSYQWQIDDEKKFGQETRIQHRFHRVGVHTVTVLVRNMVSEAHVNISVVIHYAIEDPVLQMNSPQKINQAIIFYLSAEQLGTNSCFSVDFGDGTRSLFGHPRCKARNSTSSFIVKSAVESVKFEHVYNQAGQYVVSLNASNEVSFVSLSKDVEVVSASCASPSVEIENLGETSSTAPTSLRSEPFIVHTLIHLDCERSNKVKFSWRLLLLDKNGVQSKHKGKIILNERELNIPKKTLQYGVYEIQFTAQMAIPETDKFRGTTIGYLKIVPSPLIAKIDGGNLISRGFGKKLKIDASPSKDPDVENGQDSGLSYTWLCRSIHTQFQQNLYAHSNLRTPYDTTGQPAITGIVHSKGCYGDGEFVLAGRDSWLTLDTPRMMEDETYVVFVVITKGGRIAHEYQVVEVIQGDPPVSKLECKQNCGEKICPSKRFSLVGTCFEGCIGRLIYEWQVYKNIGNDSIKSWELQQDIAQSLAEVKDAAGAIFVLPKDTLEGASEYLIRLYGRRARGVNGKTESVYVTNEVPQGGACFGWPPSGDALVTKFYIWCEGWKDPDMPLSYQFYYKNDEGKLVLFYFGLNNFTHSELPLGNPMQNYTLEIIVKVLDFNKGEAKYSFLLQSVEPKIEGHQLDNMLANMTLGENSQLSNLVNVGDSQAALRMVGAINSLLNAQSTKTPSGNDSEREGARKEKRKEVRTLVIKAVASLPVTSLEGLQQSADTIASASMFTDETSTTAMNASTEAFERMSALLMSSSDDFAGYDAVVSSAESLLSGMGQVLNAAGSSVDIKPKKMNTTKAPPTCGPYDFDCREVDSEFPGNSTDDEIVELDEESAKSRDTANAIVGMLGTVSGSVLENKLPGEKPSVISTAKLNIAVERADPNSPGGSSIGDGASGFKMPSLGKLFGKAGSDLDGPVDKEMAAVNENPYTWDKGSWSITGKVVSLSFKSKGKKLSVSNLDEDEPIDVFIPRDSPVSPPDEFIYNCSVHKGRRTHKLLVDKNGTAVNVEVRIIGLSRQFVVYVRRGKAPTTTEFDWRAVSPNITEEERLSLIISEESRNSTDQDPTSFSTLLNSTLNETITLQKNITYGNYFSPRYFKDNPLDSSLTLFLSQKRLYVGTYFISIYFSSPSSLDGQRDPTECKDDDLSITYTLRTFKSKCLYWNEEFQKWKSDGCQVGNLTSVTRTHCRCSHLTAFGSMMDVAPNPIDYSAVLAGFSSMFETGNVVVFFFIIAMFLIYVLVLVWARRADKRDMQQVGATPIPSNVSDATYHYELTFFTGQRSGAGTTAQVSCLLFGERGDSGICILKDENRPTFQKGSANSFVISVAKSLGPITFLRVWHDNHGLSPSWFLKRVLVRDIRSGAVTILICERWFALDEDDGEITRDLTPAGEKDLTSFSRLFNSKLYKDFTDAHLWFSVILKPCRSKFTRSQRASCCLCLLCTAMVSSAMFYGQTASGENGGSLVLGPIEVNLVSIMIGIQCSLVIIPVNVAIVTIFKSAKPRRTEKTDEETEEQSSSSSDEENCVLEVEISDIDETKKGDGKKAPPNEEVHLNSIDCSEDDSCSVDNADLVMGNRTGKNSSGKMDFFRNRRDGGHKYVVQTDSLDPLSSDVPDETSGNLVEERKDTTKWWCCRKQKKDIEDYDSTIKSEEEEEEEDKKKKKSDGFLPHWCLYIAWTLCIMASFTSALYTLFYSMMWGRDKSNQWFFSMILTFAQDTLINQPAKVLFLSVAYAIFIRKSDEETDAEQGVEDPRKGQDEEWLHGDILDNDDRKKELLRYKLPDESKLNALRETRIREKQLKNKFIKLGDYTFVVLVLVVLSYGNRDSQSFMMRYSMEKEFIHPLTASYPQGITDVNNLQLFMTWTEKTLIPYLYEHDWYNGDKVTNRTGYTSGRQSRRLGRIRLRQIRVENGSCSVTKLLKEVIHECNPPFDEEHEDIRIFSPEWRAGYQPAEDTLVYKRSASGQLSPWAYLDPTESNSSFTFYGRIAFYPGGGYVAEFGDSLEETTTFVKYLKSTHWIDKYTRAVFIEGALYNPNTNLIGVIETGVEVTSGNAFIPRVDFKIFRLFARLNPSYAFNSACELLFFLIILYTLYTIIKGIYQRRKEYFCETVSQLDIILFVNGIAIVVVYVVRESKLKSVVATHTRDQEWFTNFSECASYNEALVVLCAFADFVAILKFIHFLSFTRVVQLLSTTIEKSVVELQSFAVMLFAIYMAYSSMAFTVFAPYVEDYRSFSATLASLSCLVMGVFDHTDFTSQSDYKTVGYFFFTTFSASMIFIFTNIVITIISGVHQNVCSDEELKKNEDSFFNIILDRVLIFIGFKGPPIREEPVIEEPTIAEMQWNLSINYIENSQLKRFKGLFKSINYYDEIEDISLVRAYTKTWESKTTRDTGYQGDTSKSNAADKINDDEHGRTNNAGMKSQSQEELVKKDEQQLENPSSVEAKNNPAETLNKLIVKKAEELRRLEEQGVCDEKERLRRVKVIECLQDLLKKSVGDKDSAKLFLNHEEESQV